MLFRHFADDFANEILTRLQKSIERHRILAHSVEAAHPCGYDSAGDLQYAGSADVVIGP